MGLICLREVPWDDNHRLPLETIYVFSGSELHCRLRHHFRWVSSSGYREYGWIVPYAHRYQLEEDRVLDGVQHNEREPRRFGMNVATAYVAL